MPPIGGWKSGVYMIRNKANGKVYVGSSATSIKKRWKNHKNNLRHNKEGRVSRHLQAAWNKYGEESFEFTVILYCSPLACIENEQKYLDKHKAADPRHGYNLSPVAGSSIGVKHTRETKAKYAAATKRYFSNDENRARSSERAKILTSCPKWRSRQSKAVKEAFTRPDVRDRHSKAINDPEVAARRRTNMMNTHSKPEYKEKIKQAIEDKILDKAMILREIVGDKVFTRRDIEQACGTRNGWGTINAFLNRGLILVYTKGAPKVLSTYQWNIVAPEYNTEEKPQ